MFVTLIAVTYVASVVWLAKRPVAQNLRARVERRMRGDGGDEYDDENENAVDRELADSVGGEEMLAGVLGGTTERDAYQFRVGTPPSPLGSGGVGSGRV